MLFFFATTVLSAWSCLLHIKPRDSLQLACSIFISFMFHPQRAAHCVFYKRRFKSCMQGVYQAPLSVCEARGHALQDIKFWNCARSFVCAVSAYFYQQVLGFNMRIVHCISDAIYTSGFAVYPLGDCYKTYMALCISWI